MSIIEDVSRREILDSRGNPTVEVEVELVSGARGRAAVPSGASTGAHEAVELRDGGRPLRRQGCARRRRARERRDRATRSSGSTPPTSGRSTPSSCALDGTDNKGRLGANAILGVSLAAAKAVGRGSASMPLYRYVGGANAHVLPVPLMNVLNGGAHADSNVDLQEFMLAPGRRGELLRSLAVGRRDLPRVASTAARARPLDRTRRRRRLRARSPVERGGAASCSLAAIERAGYRPGAEIAIALDVAATEFFAPACTSSPARAARSRAPSSSTTSPTSASATRSFRSKTAWPRTTGTAGPR